MHCTSQFIDSMVEQLFWSYLFCLVLMIIKLSSPCLFGLNFALEKWCAMSQGRRIFIATHKVFLSAGQPKWERFSRSDNIHPNGPGTDILLQELLQQAMSPQYMLE